MGTKLDDEMVNAALRNFEGLPPKTVAALQLADVLTGDDPVVTPEFHSELRQHFSEQEILELGSALAVASGWQRFIEAFGIRPDSWSEDQPLPARPGI